MMSAASPYAVHQRPTMNGFHLSYVCVLYNHGMCAVGSSISLWVDELHENVLKVPEYKEKRTATTGTS